MARLGLKRLHYYELVRRKSVTDLLYGKDLTEADLVCLIAGKYITEDHFGFSMKQVSKLTGYALVYVRMEMGKLNDLGYVRKVKKETGHFKKRYSALWALTAHGEELIRLFNVKNERLLNKATRYEL